MAEGLAKSGYKVGVITNNIEEILVTEVINDVNIYRISNKSLYTEEAGISDNSLVSHRRLMKGVNHFVNKFGAPSIIIFPDLFCFPEASILAKQFDAHSLISFYKIFQRWFLTIEMGFIEFQIMLKLEKS